MGFLLNCIIQYKILPDHDIKATEDAKQVQASTESSSLTKNQEYITYVVFVIAVIGMLLQSYIGDAGYAIAGLSVAVILISGVMDFNEIRNSISAPIILMSAGVIGVADALGATGLTDLAIRISIRNAGYQRKPLRFDFGILYPDQRTCNSDRFHHRNGLHLRSSGHATCSNMGLDPTAAACRNRYFRMVRTLPSHRRHARYGNGASETTVFGSSVNLQFPSTSSVCCS